MVKELKELIGEWKEEYDELFVCEHHKYYLDDRSHEYTITVLTEHPEFRGPKWERNDGGKLTERTECITRDGTRLYTTWGDKFIYEDEGVKMLTDYDKRIGNYGKPSDGYRMYKHKFK